MAFAASTLGCAAYDVKATDRGTSRSLFGDGIESVAQGLTVALGYLEELVASARTFGVEPRDAPGILSEEFSKLVAKYEELHPESSSVTFETGDARCR